MDEDEEDDDNCLWAIVGIVLVVLSFIPNLMSFCIEFQYPQFPVAALRYMRVAYFIGIAIALSIFATIGCVEGPLDKSSSQLRVGSQIVAATLSLACAGVLAAIIHKSHRKRRN